jgi:hypothetical membrane protein
MIGGGQFIIMTFIAMIFYPDGYSFTKDYFSYLGTTTNIKTGSDNEVSRILFLIACVLAGTCLIPFWIVLRTSFTKTKLMRYSSLFGTLMGILSSIFLMGVGLFAEDNQYSLHSSSAKMFFVFFIAAIFAFSFVILLNSEYQNIFSFLGVIFCVTVIIILYVFRFSTIISVITQKIIVYGFCMWAVLQITQVWKNSKKI